MSLLVSALPSLVGTLALLALAGNEPVSDFRQQGKGIYEAHCARCHGANGDDRAYPGVKSLVGLTERMPGEEILDKSVGFAGVRFQGQDAASLLTYLGTLKASDYGRPELLIETQGLATRLKDPMVRIIDLRPASLYAAGHVPGAVNLEEGPLKSNDDKETYLPSPEAFAALMERLGVRNQDHLLLYDDQAGRTAAKFWYVLAAYGHTRVSIVNGGWPRWVAEKRPTTTEVPTVPAGRFQVKKSPALTCSSSEATRRKPGTVVLDTRTSAEYGRGRIPGAVLVDWTENVAGEPKLFRPAAELRKLYESKGVTPDKEIITYCLGGGRASHTLFTLTLLGYPRVRVYYGSWGDYATRGAPVEK